MDIGNLKRFRFFIHLKRVSHLFTNVFSLKRVTWENKFKKINILKIFKILKVLNLVDVQKSDFSGTKLRHKLEI